MSNQDKETIKRLFLTNEEGEEMFISSPVTQEDDFNVTAKRPTKGTVTSDGREYIQTYKISFKMGEV